MTPYYTITARDVCNFKHLTPTQRRHIRSCLGRVLKCDVGKRIYLVQHNDGVGVVSQVESQQQLATRLGSRV